MTTPLPIADRPGMVDYGILPPEEGNGLLPWDWAIQRLEASRNYWIATTRPDGRPHVAPVWGVWLEGAVLFGTSPTSRKARNIAANPHVVVHLESGDEAVILEGVVERVTDAALLARMDEALGAKYNWRPSDDDADISRWPPIYALRPQVAFGWLESDFPGSATRWRFHG